MVSEAFGVPHKCGFSAIVPSVLKNSRGEAAKHCDDDEDRSSDCGSTKRCRHQRPRPPVLLARRRPGGGLFAGLDAEPGEDLGDVVLGGGGGDVEALGDLFVREAFAEEGEDLPFARCEDVGVGGRPLLRRAGSLPMVLGVPRNR